MNGESSLVLSSYPATLHFHYQVNNTHPTLPSELLTAEAPLLAPFGWSFTPAPPVTIPVGNSVTYDFDHTINSLADCEALGGGQPAFSDTLEISWDTGTAQCSTFVECEASPQFTCGDTLYVSSRVATVTDLHSLDPTTFAMAPISTTAVWGYDAMGLNPLDGHIYAISNVHLSPDPNPHLIRIASDGSIEDVRSLPELAGHEWIIGTVTRTGTYVLGDFGTTWATIDLPTLTVTQTGHTVDHLPLAWAVNPNDDTIYGYNSYTARLCTFDPTTGVLADYGPTLPNVGIQPCSGSFTTDGTFYLQCYTVNPLENALFAVNVTTSVATFLPPQPPLAIGDMTSCPFVTPATPRPLQDRGFYLTHEQALTSCLASGDIELAPGIAIDSVQEALQLLWANPALDLQGAPTPPERALRTQLARELVVGECNRRLFAPSNDFAQALQDAENQWLSGAAGQQGTLERLLSLHHQGARLTPPRGFQSGPSTPVHAVDLMRSVRGTP
ncbi:hypothetical protein JGU66_23015 [Myxococcaceae bacterium JPH2]|nr:hypothetical protein [Myxococcaceae bacterium JPH2]